jgi:hypothetical protein
MSACPNGHDLAVSGALNIIVPASPLHVSTIAVASIMLSPSLNILLNAGPNPLELAVFRAGDTQLPAFPLHASPSRM